MKKVLIPTKLDETCKKMLEKTGPYVVVQSPCKDAAALEALAAAHPDAYALIVRSEKITSAVIEMFPALRVVVRAGSGFDNIDTKFARKKGIDVMTTPGANANAVAEEVIALMLADARFLVQADAPTRAGEWKKDLFMGREISGKTVGIVGLGAIGQLVARRLSGFECTLLGYDPVISQERAGAMDVELVDLPTLFERSDYVSLHIPENSETRGLVNAALLGRMKPGATLINCARAGIINEEDLRKLRAEKAVRFLNDVYPKDAEGPKTVADIADIMLPHLGASTREANAKAATHAAAQLIEFDEKGISSFIVNRDIPPGLDRDYADLAYTLARLARMIVGRDTKLKAIETSFYGSLKPYAPWLLVPIVAALSDAFDRSMDATAAGKFLHEMGIDYDDRDTDDRKKYGNAITVDLTATVDGETLRETSIRGTVTDGILMVARINDFHKLYFEPKGPAVFFAYVDRPGVLGQIGSALARAGINIDDVRNPHDSRGEYSLAMMKVNKAVPDEVVAAIARDIQAMFGFYVEL